MSVDLDIVVYICTAIGSIAAAAGIVVKMFKKTIKNTVRETLSDSMEDYSKNLDRRIESLNDIVNTFITSQDHYNTKVQQALLCTTRDRINQAHDYYTRRNWIGSHSLFVVEELYASYKDLGGNSFVDRQMEDIRNLEVRSAETNKS